MRYYKTVVRYLLILCFAIILNNVAQAQSESEKHDIFGAVNCEQELAILDNIENKLKSYPFTTVYFYVYGGKRDTKRNEVETRSSRMKRYLTETRRIESGRVEIIAAEFRDKFTVEVWLVSVGENPPKIAPTISRKKIRFKKGKMSKWEEPGCYVGKYQT